MSTAATKHLLGALSPGSIHWVGDGFHVRNLFPSNEVGEAISPFLLLDYAGPSEFPPAAHPRGVGPHPHAGFETVTLVFEGAVDHRDSAGHAGSLGPGDVQWMTAGAGVVHDEMHGADFTREGGTLRMVQLWVNLPAVHKGAEPRYQDIVAADIPTVEKDGARIRVIAGECAGTAGPAETFTPVQLWDLDLAGNAPVELELPEGQTAAFVCLRGDVEVADAELGEGQMAVLSLEGNRATLRSTSGAQVLFLGGEPLGEPVVSYGPFVMNTRDEIARVVREYQSGAMGRL